MLREVKVVGTSVYHTLVVQLDLVDSRGSSSRAARPQSNLHSCCWHHKIGWSCIVNIRWHSGETMSRWWQHSFRPSWHYGVRDASVQFDTVHWRLPWTSP